MSATAMNDTRNTSASYEVGYGKPPRRTQFRKGQSGNPGGRPRRPPMERVNALLLEEAYRCVAIMENGRMEPVTAVQAILRSQVELAMNGNLRAQRYVLEEVRHLEILKASGVYGEPDEDELYDFRESDEEDESGEADEVADSEEADENDEVDEFFESGEEDEAGEVGECDDEDETGESDETGSEDTGTVVTAATDPVPPPQSSAAPRVSSAAPRARSTAPQAPPPVDSTWPRPTAPSRRRTPARAHARAGRRHSVTKKPPMDSAPAARKRGRIPLGNSGSEESGKFPVKFPVLRESPAPRRRA